MVIVIKMPHAYVAQVITTIVPMIGVLSFSTGCYKEMHEAFSNDVSYRRGWPAGLMLFITSVLVLIPIAIIHVIIPSAATSAFDDKLTSVTKKTEEVSV